MNSERSSDELQVRFDSAVVERRAAARRWQTMKSGLALSFLILFLIVFAPLSAHACSCSKDFTVKQKFEEAGNVLIVRLVSVNQTEGEPRQYEFSVERVFKGEKKPGDQIRFRWRNSCSPSFETGQIGERFLYFLSEKPDEDGFFVAPYCYGWGGLSARSRDLLYLEKPAATRQKTRIAGTLKKTFHDPNNDYEFKTEPIARQRVRIVGSGVSRVVATDDNGNFEIYGLPAGEYKVYAPKIIGWRDGENFKEVTLKTGGDAEVDFLYVPDNTVSGRLISREGKPFKQVRVMLFPENKTATIEADGEDYFVPGYDPFDITFPSALTDEAGEFDFVGIAPGRYRLVVNRLGDVTSEAPFGAFFYPGTAEESKATVFAIGAGTKIRNLVLTPPKLVEMITLRGRVVFKDGKPAKESFVEFLKPGETESSRLEMNLADQNGEFTIRVPKGTAGALQAWFSFYTDDADDCPQLRPFLKGDYKGSHVVRTATIEIDGQNDRDNLEFVLPFAECPDKNP